MATSSSSSSSFIPFILGLFLSISIFISLISPSHSVVTCASQDLSSNRTYANCIDLPWLGATLHFTYNKTNSSYVLAYAASPPSSNGWVAWGFNLYAQKMKGAEAFVAYENNGSVAVYPYNLASTKVIIPVKSLSVETWDLAATESNNVITIFAAVKLPIEADKISMIWQVGPIVSGTPGIHGYKKDNLKATMALPTSAPASEKSGGVSFVMGERLGLGFYIGLLVSLLMSFITM